MSVCLLSGKLYNALNYITLILNRLDSEAVSVPAEDEPAECPGGQKGRRHPGLYQQ